MNIENGSGLERHRANTIRGIDDMQNFSGFALIALGNIIGNRTCRTEDRSRPWDTAFAGRILVVAQCPKAVLPCWCVLRFNFVGTVK